LTTDLTQPGVDPHLQASYSVANRARRAVWNLFYALFFRTSPRPFHGWRSMILRLFGAKLAPNCHFYPKCRIWAPWNLVCEEAVGVGDDAELYNPSLLTIGSHAVISQGAYVCGATHLYNEPSFRLVSYPMRIGAYSWVCAKAIVSPGVNVGDGAILAMASVATRDLEPFGVYAGMPARKVKDRDRAAVPALLSK
jgi:putative colanic acid biosynthesis acetyltransferase WcaF